MQKNDCLPKTFTLNLNLNLNLKLDLPRSGGGISRLNARQLPDGQARLKNICRAGNLRHTAYKVTVLISVLNLLATNAEK